MKYVWYVVYGPLSSVASIHPPWYHLSSLFPPYRCVSSSPSYLPSAQMSLCVVAVDSFEPVSLWNIQAQNMAQEGVGDVCTLET